MAKFTVVNDSVHSPIEAALKFPLPSSDAVVSGFSVGNDRAIAVAKAKAAEVAYKEKQKGRAVATAANVQGAVWETTVYPLPYNVEVTIAVTCVCPLVPSADGLSLHLPLSFEAAVPKVTLVHRRAEGEA